MKEEPGRSIEVRIRIVPPPDVENVSAEEQQLQRGLEALERGDINLPRPSDPLNPMDVHEWQAESLRRLLGGTSSKKRGAKKGPRGSDTVRWRTELKWAFGFIEAREKRQDSVISTSSVAEALSITPKTLWRRSEYYAARDPRDSYWAILEEYRRGK